VLKRLRIFLLLFLAWLLVTWLVYGDNGFEWRIPASACTTDSLRAR
jgi:hypothetical protein